MATKYKVGDIMERDVITANSSESILNCAKKMSEKRIGCLIITSEGSVVGVITEQDIARKVVAREIDPVLTQVEHIMSREVESVDSSRDIQEAIIHMGNNEIKHLPVIDNGKLVGIITSKDIVIMEPVLMEMLKFKHTNNV